MHLHFSNYPEGWTYSTPGAPLFWWWGSNENTGLVCIFSPPVLNKVSMGTKFCGWFVGAKNFFYWGPFQQIKYLNIVEIKTSNQTCP